MSRFLFVIFFEVITYFSRIVTYRYKPVTQPLTSNGISIDNDIEVYEDPEHMQIISYPGKIPILSSTTRSLKYPVIVPRTGRYVIVIDYISHRDQPSLYYINVRIANSPTPDSDSDYGAVLLYPCLYSMICRQPVVDDASREKQFFIDETNQFPIEVYVSFLRKKKKTEKVLIM